MQAEGFASQFNVPEGAVGFAPTGIGPKQGQYGANDEQNPSTLLALVELFEEGGKPDAGSGIGLGHGCANLAIIGQTTGWTDASFVAEQVDFVAVFTN